MHFSSNTCSTKYSVCNGCSLCYVWNIIVNVKGRRHADFPVKTFIPSPLKFQFKNLASKLLNGIEAWIFDPEHFDFNLARADRKIILNPVWRIISPIYIISSSTRIEYRNTTKIWIAINTTLRSSSEGVTNLDRFLVLFFNRTTGLYARPIRNRLKTWWVIGERVYWNYKSSASHNNFNWNFIRLLKFIISL